MATPHASSLVTVIKEILHFLDDKFIRARLNGPRQSLLVLLTIIHSGVNRIGIKPAKLVLLGKMDAFLRWDAGVVPSVSAIARALHKLKPSQLEGVVAVGLAGVAQAFGTHLFQHGYRLVAIDGVRINTQRTRALTRFCGRPRCGKRKRAHQPQALVVVARCVRTGVILAQEMVSHDGNERACALRLCDQLASCGRVILLFDRGFPDHKLIYHLHQHNMTFIMRMNTGKTAWNEVRPFIKRRTDSDNTLHMCLKKGDQPTTLRFILSRTTHHKKLRTNSKAQRLAILTNLTDAYWKTERIIAIYHRRWDIETTFREDKRLFGATKSRAKTPDAFLNELYALHIYRIIMALIHAIACVKNTMPSWEDIHAQRYVTTQLSIIAWICIEIITANKQIDEGKIQSLIKELNRDAPKKRPGRSYKRICKGKEGAWKNKKIEAR